MWESGSRVDVFVHVIRGGRWRFGHRILEYHGRVGIKSYSGWPPRAVREILREGMEFIGGIFIDSAGLFRGSADIDGLGEVHSVFVDSYSTRETQELPNR